MYHLCYLDLISILINKTIQYAFVMCNKKEMTHLNSIYHVSPKHTFSVGCRDLARTRPAKDGQFSENHLCGQAKISMKNFRF